MSALESKNLELVIITYHDDFLKVAEIREGMGGAYEKLAAVVGLSQDDLKLLDLLGSGLSAAIDRCIKCLGQRSYTL